MSSSKWPQTKTGQPSLSPPQDSPHTQGRWFGGGEVTLGSASDVSIISKEKIKCAGAHLAVLLQPSSPRHNVAAA